MSLSGYTLKLGSPVPGEKVYRLLTEISDFLNHKDGDSPAQLLSTAERLSLLASARGLVSALESPQETNVRVSWEEPTTAAALRLLLEYGVFSHMVGMNENDSPRTTASDLAAKCGDEHGLIRRLLKRVANASYINEVGPDEYVPTALTWHFSQKTNAGFYKSNYDSLTPARSALAKCMRETDYLAGACPDKSPWNQATGIEVPFFKWMSLPGQESEMRHFAQAMAFKNASVQPKWYDNVPIDEIFPGFLEPDEVLLVDVGGNIGGDLVNFHASHPSMTGRLILQDLPELLETLKPETLKPIEVVPHDFLAPQPIAGAKAYLLRNILHDWPDQFCKQILEMLKQAMTPGYSKILINEIVMPEEGANSMTTALDMIMLLKYSSKERRKGEWSQLLESIGLRVVKIWDCGDGPEKLIEVDLA